MLISLIGYSGIGKSLLSRRLEEELGWLRFSCDEMIAERMEQELGAEGGAGEARLAAWMGFPWEPESERRQQIYLLLEEQVLDEICDALEEARKSPKAPNIVVDTTGSCIYVDSDVLARLQKLSTIVFLESTENEESELIASFFRNPKPIIWANMYNERDDEPHETAIRRCYPDLLESRRAGYANLAKTQLRIDSDRRHGLSAAELVELLRSASDGKL